MPKSRGRKPSRTSGGSARGPRRPAPPARPRPAGQGRAETPGQAGRRPSSPAFLLVVALVWITCGVVALVVLHASWKLVPGIVFIGVGLLFLRGAAATVVRRDQRRR